MFLISVTKLTYTNLKMVALLFIAFGGPIHHRLPSAVEESCDWFAYVPRYGFVQTITFEFQARSGLDQRWIIRDDEEHLKELAELYGYGGSGIPYGRFADMRWEE
jgi:hypothetical protein